MQELLYLEIPHPDTAAVRGWLQDEWIPAHGKKVVTPDGLRLAFPPQLEELSIFLWSAMRSTYLKVFRWGGDRVPEEKAIVQQLTSALRDRFPQRYPEPPDIDLSQQSIFEALAPYYPKTVEYFQKIPNGEFDLNRVYWWEKRWRESVKHPQDPKQVIFFDGDSQVDKASPEYDIVYIGGALGVIHAAVMARRGYKVLLIERLPFGHMNREWNISRGEFQSLIDLDLFSQAEFESIIAAEYADGFNKFFDANNPPQSKAKILHTPKVLNIAVDAEKLLRLCGKKLTDAGGTIWDETEFESATVRDNRVEIQAKSLQDRRDRVISSRLLIDAMGTASPIAWQLNGGRTFDSVCPTVGGIVSAGMDFPVWDTTYGDVLHSHGDISRGRQLIWELFPGKDGDLTIYLFHYHQVCAENPGSLLEMYEDFFHILPEYRRCNMEQLQWKKATFGYIPGYFSVSSDDRKVACDRVVAIGDAASLQSPLVFTGFGSLVRNMNRLTDLLDTALKYDLLTNQFLQLIRAYQSNIAVTWLFSKGMMVPTGKYIAPQRINATLNTFFGLLAEEPLEVADTFIKDRLNWWTFNRLAIVAARKNPALLLWIWELAGPVDLFRWVGSYLNFTWQAIWNFLMGWLPRSTPWVRPYLETHYPGLWLRWLATHYVISEALGRSIAMRP